MKLSINGAYVGHLSFTIIERQISDNHLQYQPQTKDDIVQFTKLILVVTIMIVKVFQWILMYQFIVLLFEYISLSGIITMNNNNLNDSGTMFEEVDLKQIIYANNLLSSSVLIALIWSILCNIKMSKSTISITRDDTEYTDKLEIHLVGINPKGLYSTCNVYTKLIIYSSESLFYDNIFMSTNIMNNISNKISKSFKFIYIITHSDKSISIAYMASNIFKRINIIATNLDNSYPQLKIFNVTEKTQDIYTINNLKKKSLYCTCKKSCIRFKNKYHMLVIYI